MRGFIVAASAVAAASELRPEPLALDVFNENFHVNAFCRSIFFDPESYTSDHSKNLLTGEVTYDGMENLYAALKLRPDDVFYDLGSGTGKLVLYVALRAQVAKSVGLEIGERRHELASMAGVRLAEMPADANSKLPSLEQPRSEFEVVQADICRYPYHDVSVVVFTNVCMDMQVQSRTLDQLLKCQKFRRLACTSPMMPHKRLKLVKTVAVACSWAKISSWHIYDVLPAPPPRSTSLLRSGVTARMPAWLPRTSRSMSLPRSAKVAACSSTPALAQLAERRRIESKRVPHFK